MGHLKASLCVINVHSMSVRQEISYMGDRTAENLLTAISVSGASSAEFFCVFDWPTMPPFKFLPTHHNIKQQQVHISKRYHLRSNKSALISAHKQLRSKSRCQTGHLRTPPHSASEV